jgi:hypothetical protein
MVVGIIVVLLMTVYVWGTQKCTHQDDLDWFILANRPLGQVLTADRGSREYVWRVLLSAEWNSFHLNFSPYPWSHYSFTPA